MTPLGYGPTLAPRRLQYLGLQRRQYVESAGPDAQWILVLAASLEHTCDWWSVLYYHSVLHQCSTSHHPKYREYTSIISVHIQGVSRL